MIPYKNLGRGSGVIAYEPGADYIRIMFNTGKVYRYSDRYAGSSHVSNMKSLAAGGKGLNSYINKYTRLLYDR